MPLPRAQDAAVLSDGAHVEDVAAVGAPDVVGNVALAGETAGGGVEGGERRGLGDALPVAGCRLSVVGCHWQLEALDERAAPSREVLRFRLRIDVPGGAGRALVV